MNSGLSASEVEQRVAAGQVNALPPRSGRSIAQIAKDNIFTRINAILFTLFVIVMTTGSWINGAFGLLIIANSAIGMIQEIRAKQTLDALAVVGEAKPRVRRLSGTAAIARDQVVLDDLIEVAPGEQIVVDGVIVEAEYLEVDESLLTGESDPMPKECRDEVMSGSFVVSGTGCYRASRVGADAYAAQITAEAAKFTLVKSELQSGINKILRVITWVLIPVGLLTIITQLSGASQWRSAVLSMAGALVPMVPEGLVLLTSMAFALGVIRLGKRQCLVQELPAIEGLARVDVVCADKTGTLTENGMAFSELVPVSDTPPSAIASALAQIVACDPTPNASMVAVSGAYPLTSEPWPVAARAPFTSAKKWSGVSFANGQNWVIGAADVLSSPNEAADGLPVGEASADALPGNGPGVDGPGGCSVLGIDESAEPVGPAESGPGRPSIAVLAEEIGRTGRRVLLLGQAEMPVDAAQAPGVVTPVALLVLDQRVRPEARETLDFFAQQHVALKVISGDNAASVGAVTRSLGVDVGEVVDARTLAEPSSETFISQVEQASVFGRVTPHQKRAMVAALQSKGHTVAMTGDGVNDVLALKDADLGVAMGSGSSATRSVAQIVLLDDNFATLPHVVGEGRRVIGNIERVANLFLTKTIYSAVLAILVIVWRVPFPFQPIHVTITGWFTIGIPAFLLSLAPNYERARTGFVYRVLRLGVPAGLVVAVATFATYLIGLRVEPGPTASTAALAALITSATWVLSVVARPYKLWKIALIALSVLMYPMIFLVPFTSKLFLLDASNHSLMWLGIGIGLIGAVLIEAIWWWRRSLPQPD